MRSGHVFAGVGGNRRWDTRARKHNDHMGRSTVPLLAKLLIYLNLCTPPLGTIVFT
jgi:hypothetical protein